MVVENVTQVVDAPPTWFGPHASGVDPADWNNASMLPNRPPVGLFRHQTSQLTACVMDTDYDLTTPSPVFYSSRGTLGNVSYVPQSAANLYCYTTDLSLEIGSELGDVDLEVRTGAGSLLLQRTLRIDDKPPELSLFVESTLSEQLDRVVGDGNEQVRIRVSDVDDPATSFVGDLTIHWPGGEPIELPLDISGDGNDTVIVLEQMLIPLEAGELQLVASGRGQHGATATEQLNVPFLLTPPELLLFEACDATGVVRNMTFGQIATLVVVLASERPLQSSAVQLAQSGWAINAPSMEAPVWGEGEPPLACDISELMTEDATVMYFRLKLDNSLVDGEGRVVFSTSNIDGLVKSQGMDLVFQHAPTVIEGVEFSEAIPGSDLYTNVTVSDLDGLDRVVCAFSLYGQDDALLTQSVVTAGPEGVFSNTLSYRYPLTVAVANTTLSANINCMDNLQQSFSSNASIGVMSATPCQNCTDKQGEEQTPSNDLDANNTPLLLLIVAVVAIAITSGLLVLRRRGPTDDLKWASDEFEPYANTEELFERDQEEGVLSESVTPESHDIVPEGWSLDDYTSWLDGPLPEGWTEEQWRTYVEESKATLASSEVQAEG